VTGVLEACSMASVNELDFSHNHSLRETISAAKAKLKVNAVNLCPSLRIWSRAHTRLVGPSHGLTTDISKKLMNLSRALMKMTGWVFPSHLHSAPSQFSSKQQLKMTPSFLKLVPHIYLTAL